jgi:ABC-type dipeptide/oligopeptide/nickel transport system permease component
VSRYLLKRVGLSLLTILGIVVVVFFVSRVLPGDAAALRAGPYADAERIEQVRTQLGFDRPLPEQFVDHTLSVARLDLGVSSRSNQPVRDELFARLPATLELGLYALFLACLVGIPLGVLAARRQGRPVDVVIRSIAVLGSSMALFWLGLLLLYFGFFRLGWFPGPVDRLPIGASPPRQLTGFFTLDALLAGDPRTALTALHHLALPVLTLAIVLTAPIIKMVRGAMCETLGADYTRTARAVGVPARRYIWTDGFRNALLPVVTAIGIVFGYLLGGNIIVEFIFSWPGVGRYAYQAIQSNDLQALQGFVILVGLLYVLLNLLIDLLYARIDPRVRLGGTVGA